MFNEDSGQSLVESQERGCCHPRDVMTAPAFLSHLQNLGQEKGRVAEETRLGQPRMWHFTPWLPQPSPVTTCLSQASPSLRTLARCGFLPSAINDHRLAHRRLSPLGGCWLLQQGSPASASIVMIHGQLAADLVRARFTSNSSLYSQPLALCQVQRVLSNLMDG